MPVIEFEGVTKRFGDLVAVDELSFSVEQGNVVGFLGPNGAGKTTTLRILLGLVEPTAGRAVVNGRLYRQLHKPMGVVGAVLESSGAYPGRTARNHLRVEALVGDVRPSRVDEVLDLAERGIPIFETATDAADLESIFLRLTAPGASETASETASASASRAAAR
jgi:ABC-2 type transport system ATP-binding protein